MKIFRPHFILLVAVALTAVSCASTFADRPKNVILLIGDGMGVAHLTYGYLASDSLNAERMPVGGLIKTFPYGGMITDSAASGTAMATGYKTRNGMVSISPEGDTLTTIFEYAEENGMSTGLVATSSITHATPAVFTSHVVDRGMQAEIARQQTGSGLDLIIGGGWAYFVPAAIEGSRRTDDLDLIGSLGEMMPVVRSVEEMKALDVGTTAAAVFLAPRECPPATEREYSLADLTSKAIEILSAGGNGFILMVEGSQIDWAAHDGDGEALFYEMKDFNGAVGAALDFAELDGETLVIMTADHETGGVSLHETPIDSSTVVKPEFSTDDHTMEMVPIFVFGPGAAAFGGIHDNTFIGAALIEFVRK
jgi:alkaline phosphatase